MRSMAVTLYGSPQSRSLRVVWAAAELGLSIDHIPLAWDDPALKAAEFLAINPAGRVPVIVDGDLALPESLAITFYLAKTYPSADAEPLYPTDPHDEARAWSWTHWAIFDLEAPLETLRRHRFLLPEAERVEAVAREAEQRVGPALAILDAVLAPTPYLLGERFTVADLNVACVLSPSRTVFIDLEPFARVRGWLDRRRSRPAWTAARRALQAEDPSPASATSRPMASR